MKGFTILEVLIAITIFSIISLATVRQVQQLQNTKEIALHDLDTYSSIRAALVMIRTDVNQAFHILYDDLGEEQKQTLFQGNQALPHTLFDGRKKELIFTATSHRVYYQNVRECEQAEISYFLQQKQGSKYVTLMKRESGLIDNDLFQGGAFYSLLDNVVSLTFDYWNERTGKWVDDWNSDNGEFRDRFPYAIRIKLVVADPGKTDISIQSVIKIANPNNSPSVITL